jgi:cellulase/cellobiase CelA1
VAPDGAQPTTQAVTSRPPVQTARPPVQTSSAPQTSAPPAGGGGCRVSTTVSAWNNGLTENITITNAGTSTINGWKLTFTLPGGQNITSGWSATYAPTSGQVTATNVSYNGTIGPNASVGIGFQATHTGNSGAATSFALNGTTCTNA